MKLSRFVLWRRSILTGYTPDLSLRATGKEQPVSHNMARDFEEMLRIEELLELLADVNQDMNTFYYDENIKDATHLIYAARVRLLAVAAQRREAFKTLYHPPTPSADLPF